MIKNNKGFLLMETLITTCIIATLATSIYIYVSKTITNYEKRENYDNVVDVYKVNNIKLYLYNKWSHYALSDPSSWTNGVVSISLPSDMRNRLKTSQVLVVLNKPSINKSNIINVAFNKKFKEYVRLLSFTGDENAYRIIVHFQDGKNHSFASLLMKVPTTT